MLEGKVNQWPMHQNLEVVPIQANMHLLEAKQKIIQAGHQASDNNRACPLLMLISLMIHSYTAH
jgi:hypothetical protein